MNKITKTIYRVVGGIIIFIVGTLVVGVVHETFGYGMLPGGLVILGMVFTFLKFTGLWSWIKRKK